MATETTKSTIPESAKRLTEQEKQSLLRITEKLEDIPVLPATGSHLITVLNNPSVDARNVAAIISRDPVIAAKTLRLANSAYYGVRNRITTLNHAVSMLGIDAIRQMVFGFYFMDLTVKGGKSGFNVDRFWRHSMATAYLAEAITRRLEIQMVGGAEAYLAGLVHDIGKYLLYRHDRTQFLRTHELLEQQDMSPMEAEQEVFGVDHSVLGGWLADQWNLPAGLVESAIFHHRTVDKCVNKELVAIVMAADRLAIDEGCAYENARRLEPLESHADNQIRKAIRGIKPEEDTLDKLRVLLDPDVVKMEEFLTNFEGVPHPKGVETAAEGRSLNTYEPPSIKRGEQKENNATPAGTPARPAIRLWESLLLPGIAQLRHQRPWKGVAILGTLAAGILALTLWIGNPLVSFIGILLLLSGALWSLSDSLVASP